MTTRSAPGVPAGTRSTVVALARLEAVRFARHPLFLTGVGLLVLNTVIEALADPVDVGQMGQPIVPAMTLGVFGLIVAARLTRTSRSVAEVLGVPPVPERTRTAALALACLVPATVALVWAVFWLVYFGAVRPPVPDAWWFGTLPAADILSYFAAAAVVAAYGGSVLGVLVGRWLRWPGASVVAAVVLVAVTVVGSGVFAGWRPYRVVMPWVIWYGGDNGAGSDIYLPGNPRWWLVYTIGLCVLAVLAALLHDRDLPRRRLLATAAVVAVLAGSASVLSMTTGVQEERISPPTLYPEQLG